MNNVSLIVYPAPDPAKAKRFFREIVGSDPYVDSAHYNPNGDHQLEPSRPGR